MNNGIFGYPLGNGTALATIFPQGTVINSQTFTASGTFVPPTNTQYFAVLVVGGGGGGATSGPGNAGGGGGAGGVYFFQTLCPTLPVSVTIGAGGAANADGGSTILSGGLSVTVPGGLRGTIAISNSTLGYVGAGGTSGGSGGAGGYGGFGDGSTLIGVNGSSGEGCKLAFNTFLPLSSAVVLGKGGLRGTAGAFTGGGGGGGGAYGDGGAGGSSGGGGAASANTGGGGGGAGAGASGFAGGAGGSGIVIFYWV